MWRKPLQNMYRARFKKYWKLIFNLFIASIGLIVLINLLIQNNGIDIFGELSKYQFVPECSCKREYFYPLQNERVISSCSDAAAGHHLNQNVVSFSLTLIQTDIPEKLRYLDHWYKIGIAINLEQIQKYYPKYSMRVYTNVKLEGEYCSMYCNNSRLMWCDISKTPSHGDQSEMYFRTWRFLPLGDSTVDVFLSRDLDSVIIKREVDAVNDWIINTDKAFHLMRDNPWHNAEILAGLWGAINSRMEANIAHEIQSEILKLSKDPIKKKAKHFDQDVLSDTVGGYSKAIVAYDSYNCHMYNDSFAGEMKAFPTRRDASGVFVGDLIFPHRVIQLKCPYECRPTYGKEWTYC